MQLKFFSDKWFWLFYCCKLSTLGDLIRYRRIRSWRSRPSRGQEKTKSILIFNVVTILTTEESLYSIQLGLVIAYWCMKWRATITKTLPSSTSPANINNNISQHQHHQPSSTTKLFSQHEIFDCLLLYIYKYQERMRIFIWAMHFYTL